MGMFDTIRCSYDLGAGFYRRDLQTKDFHGLLGEYWLDPAGRLYRIDYSGTYDFVDDSTIKTVKNGNHGKVTPYYVTSDVTVYPSKWDCKYAPYPRITLHVKEGVVEWISKPDGNRL